MKITIPISNYRECDDKIYEYLCVDTSVYDNGFLDIYKETYKNGERQDDDKIVEALHISDLYYPIKNFFELYEYINKKNG